MSKTIPKGEKWQIAEITTVFTFFLMEVVLKSMGGKSNLEKAALESMQLHTVNISSMMEKFKIHEEKPP